MFFHPKDLKSENNNPWFKPRFNILLHTQSIVCATVDSQYLEYLWYIYFGPTFESGNMYVVINKTLITPNKSGINGRLRIKTPNAPPREHLQCMYTRRYTFLCIGRIGKLIRLMILSITQGWKTKKIYFISLRNNGVYFSISNNTL